MFYLCFIYVLFMFYLKTGSKWEVSPLRMRWFEFKEVFYWKNGEGNLVVQKGGIRKKEQVKWPTECIAKIKYNFLITKYFTIFFERCKVRFDNFSFTIQDKIWQLFVNNARTLCLRKVVKSLYMVSWQIISFIHYLSNRGTDTPIRHLNVEQSG